MDFSRPMVPSVALLVIVVASLCGCGERLLVAQDLTQAYAQTDAGMDAEDAGKHSKQAKASERARVRAINRATDGNHDDKDKQR